MASFTNERTAWVILAIALATVLAPSSARPLAAQEAAAESSPEAVADYANAAEIQNNEEFELAATEWDNFLERYPSDPLAAKARLYLGVCRMQLKEYEPAIAALSEVVKLPKFDKAEDALFNLGYCQHALGKAGRKEMHEAAAATLADLGTKFPTGQYVDQGLYFRAESLYALGQLASASKVYYELISKHPKSALRADAMYAYGVAVEEQNQPKPAGEIYDVFLREFPQHKLAAEVGMRKAETVLQQGDAAAAEKLFAVAAASPGFSHADHARMRQAFALARQEKFADSAALYAEAATNLATSDTGRAAEASASAGRSYYRAKEFDKAAEWFGKAIAASGPDATEAAHWLCRIYLQNKQPGQAAELAQKQLASASGDFAVALKMDLADALYETPEQRAAAIEQYLAIARDHADSDQAPQALYNAAFGALETKQFDRGKEYTTSFLTKFAANNLAADVQYVLAECQLQGGQLADAEATYRKLLAAHADRSERSRWTTRLGVALYAQKKYADASIALESLIAGPASDAANVEALFLAGASKFHQGDADGALAILSRALAADPRGKQADETLLLLSRAAHKKEQTEQAIDFAQRVVVEFPESKLLDQAHYRLGEYRYALGDFPGASQEYALVTKNWPESPLAAYAVYGLGWSALKGRDYASAADAFSELLAKHGDSPLAAEALVARATSRRLAGDYAGAAADVSERLKGSLSPEQKASALYEKGLAEAGMKNFAAAGETFASLLAENPSFASADKVLYEQGWALKSLDKKAEAVAVFGRLAEQFPESPLAAEALYHAAEALYEKGDYRGAARDYQTVIIKAGADELGEKAVHKLGWSLFQDKQYAAAAEQFQKQSTQWPSGPLAADASFMLAECLFKEEKYAPALAAFDALKTNLSTGGGKLSSDALADLAALHAGQSAAQLKDWASCIERLQALLKARPDSPYAAEAMYEIGQSQQNLNQGAEALKTYDAAARKELALLKGRGKVSARAYFMAGELHFENKRFKEAIQEFQRVVYGKYVEDVGAWREKSAYEAGRCADVQIAGAKAPAERSAFVQSAVKSYSWLVKNFPESSLAAEAKKRLAELASDK